MKKIIICLFAVFAMCGRCYSDDIKDVENFFNEYISAANNYCGDYFNYYTDDAKIIRVVEKPDGTKQSVKIPLEKYKCETKRSIKLAKLRNYKNKYFNVKIIPQGKDYKVSAMRMPSTSDYKVPAHFIIGRNDSGEWKIKEESMNTKVQAFLKNG